MSAKQRMKRWSLIIKNRYVCQIHSIYAYSYSSQSLLACFFITGTFSSLLLISISKCFSSVYMSITPQLNNDCLWEGLPALAVMAYPILACSTPVMLPSLSCAMTTTVTFETSVAPHMIACFTASESTVFLYFC